MKKLLLSLLVFTCLVAAAQNIPAPPNPPRLVNDFAHVMTADQVQELEEQTGCLRRQHFYSDSRGYGTDNRRLCHRRLCTENSPRLESRE